MPAATAARRAPPRPRRREPAREAGAHPRGGAGLFVRARLRRDHDRRHRARGRRLGGHRLPPLRQQGGLLVAVAAEYGRGLTAAMFARGAEPDGGACRGGHAARGLRLRARARAALPPADAGARLGRPRLRAPRDARADRRTRSRWRSSAGSAIGLDPPARRPHRRRADACARRARADRVLRAGRRLPRRGLPARGRALRRRRNDGPTRADETTACAAGRRYLAPTRRGARLS